MTLRVIEGGLTDGRSMGLLILGASEIATLAGGLRAFLDDLQSRIAIASDQVTILYLSDFSNGHQSGGPLDRIRTIERAALLMEVQQQQQ